MGTKICSKCEEFGIGGWRSECTYSCRNEQLLKLNETWDISQFVKELYKASGVYVSPSSVYKYKKIIEEFL